MSSNNNTNTNNTINDKTFINYIYYSAFGTASIICLILSILFRRRSRTSKHKNGYNSLSSPKAHQQNTKTPTEIMYISFRRNYLTVYTLVMGADWLQGPYIYDLYRSYGYQLNEIALFFVVGYLSSALFGAIAGSIADRYGRKFMAVVFCFVYGASCLATAFSNVWILVVGRLLGGIATCLLFSVFESWMVSEHHTRGFNESLLNDTFGFATFYNGLVAIVSGVVANSLATKFGPVVPYMLSFVILGVTSVLIQKTWIENYGGSKNESRNTSRESNEGFSKIKSSIYVIFSHHNILLVGIIQCLFESSMYIFVFLWSPVLEKASHATHGSLPYGIIFSSFMVSIMIGSLIFKKMIENKVSHQRVAQWTLFFAMISLLIPCFTTFNPMLDNLAFNIFEVCCGMYFPVIGSLKGKLIPEESRATIMSMFRVPLNLIVVLVLLNIDDKETGFYFALCSLLLSFSFIAATRLKLSYNNNLYILKATSSNTTIFNASELDGESSNNSDDSTINVTTSDAADSNHDSDDNDELKNKDGLEIKNLMVPPSNEQNNARSRQQSGQKE